MKNSECDAKRQKDGSMYCATRNLAWDANDKDPPECRSVPTRTQYPKGCKTLKAKQAFDFIHKFAAS